MVTPSIVAREKFVGLTFGRRALQIVDVGIGHAGRSRGAQQTHINIVEPRGVDLGRRLLHLAARFGEPVCHSLKLAGVFAVHFARRIGELHGDTELL